MFGRKQKKQAGKRPSKILTILVILFVIGSCSQMCSSSDDAGSDDDVPNEAITETAPETIETEEETTEVIEEDAEPDITAEYNNDELTAFVQAYNAISGSPITHITQIGTAGFETESYGYDLKIGGGGSVRAFSVTIEDHGDYEGMRQAFIDALVAFDGSTVEEAGAIFDEAVPHLAWNEEGDVVEHGETLINFSWPGEYEPYGHIGISRRDV